MTSTSILIVYFGSFLAHLEAVQIPPRAPRDGLYLVLTRADLFDCYAHLRVFRHADIAARNVLVGDNSSIKVADFGM